MKSLFMYIANTSHNITNIKGMSFNNFIESHERKP